MKSIFCVNVLLPSVDNFTRFDSGESSSDHDIIVFSPSPFYYDRVSFSGGGSCISIEGSQKYFKSLSHWAIELSAALKAGKTVFVALSPHKEDLAATGSTTAKSSRTYQTTKVDNYGCIPGSVKVRNSRGKTVTVKNSDFQGLYDTIKDIIEYQVVFDDYKPSKVIFTAKDGTAIGGICRFKDFPGSLVLLPYFDFETSGFVETSESGDQVWSKKALNTSKALVSQLVAIDRKLRAADDKTPPPTWLNEIEFPKCIDQIDSAISEIDSQIESLRLKKNFHILQKNDALVYSHLLYENGKNLELAIEKTLKLLGYEVENLRIGDLEIDHVIKSPDGKRMIGEAEGKDNSAIDISKFRQLESNIGEDFEREEVETPAKGIVFGNGYRLKNPEEREQQFTQKCLINAKRLGSSLIRTVDLYKVALHLLNNPDDEAYKSACRIAIEECDGDIVSFPAGLR